MRYNFENSLIGIATLIEAERFAKLSMRDPESDDRLAEAS
jgi:hypothetical protein